MFNAAIVVLAFLLVACENPFTTRTAEPPDTQNPSSFIPPTSPEFVFINLQLAISERNVENYIRSFVDSTRSRNRFTFIPDNGAAEVNPQIFTNWSLENERRYLSQLFQVTNRDSLASLSFREESPPNIELDTATFTQNYELVIQHSLAENTPVLFRGQATFSLERNDNGDWAIYRWEDFTNGVDPSWSELKAFFQ